MNIFKNIKLPSKLHNAILVIALITIVSGLIAAVEHKIHTTTDRFDIEIVFGQDVHSMITENEVRSYLKLKVPSFMQMKKIKELQLRSVEGALNKHPRIHRSDVYVNAQNIIEIKVQQKEPVFRIFQSDGFTYYLGRRGETIPVSEHYTARLPIVRLNLESNEISSKIYAELLAMDTLIRKNEFVGDLIDQLIIDDKGMMEIIPTIGDFTIKVGSTKHLQSKLSRLEKFYKNELIYKGWDTYSLIDLRFKDQIVAQKRNH